TATPSSALVRRPPTSRGAMMLISWTSRAPAFDVTWRPADGNLSQLRTNQTAVDVPVVSGQYHITVTPLDALGRRGAMAEIDYEVAGLAAPPQDVRDFR